MELKLIGKPNDKDSKTLFKIPLKEFNEVPGIAVWLVMAGVMLNNPTKKNSRFVYYTVDGDYLNGTKIKNPDKKEDRQ